MLNRYLINIKAVLYEMYVKYQQNEEEFILNTLYQRAKRNGIAESKSWNPLATSFVIVDGQKANVLALASYGNGPNPDPASRKPLENIAAMAGTQNIINLKGVAAITQRRKIKPFLSNISAQQSAFEESKKWFSLVINQWNYKESFQDNISYFTTNVISRCVLGIPEICFADAQFVRQAGKQLVESSENEPAFIKAREDLDRLNKKLLLSEQRHIQNSENYTKEKADFAASDDSKAITDKILHTQSISNLLVEANLSMLIMSGIVYLQKSPEIMQKLRIEQSEQKNLTVESLRTLPYLDCVYKETLRIVSPTAVVVRETSQSAAFEITDNQGRRRPYQTAAYARLFVPIRRIHHDHQYWKNPESFIPERFLDPAATKYFIPFSMGTRSCPAAANFNEIVFKTALILSLDYVFYLDKEVEKIPEDLVFSRWKQDYFIKDIQPVFSYFKNKVK